MRGCVLGPRSGSKSGIVQQHSQPWRRLQSNTLPVNAQDAASFCSDASRRLPTASLQCFSGSRLTSTDFSPKRLCHTVRVETLRVPRPKAQECNFGKLPVI